MFVLPVPLFIATNFTKPSFISIYAEKDIIPVCDNWRRIQVYVTQKLFPSFSKIRIARNPEKTYPGFRKRFRNAELY